MEAAGTIAPIRRSVSVSCSVERAFIVFTERTADWWPLRTHSIGEERAVGVVMEGSPGGRVYEVMADGTEASWGTILEWEPPTRLVLDWKVNPDAPGPTRIEVRFTPDGSGTRVDLEHSGWEIYGDMANAARSGYHEGWEKVLGHFTRAIDDS